MTDQDAALSNLKSELAETEPGTTEWAKAAGRLIRHIDGELIDKLADA